VPNEKKSSTRRSLACWVVIGSIGGVGLLVWLTVRSAGSQRNLTPQVTLPLNRRLSRLAPVGIGSSAVICIVPD